MKVKSESEVAQSCLTLSDPMDRSLPGSTVHEIFQARVAFLPVLVVLWYKITPGSRLDVHRHLTFRTVLGPLMAETTDTQNDGPCSKPHLDAIKS